MIEALTVCVNYWDYLLEIAPFVQKIVDSWIVVTAPHDEKTIALCEDLNIRYHVTDVFYKDGARFRKAEAINEGLELLTKQDWLLILDSDTVPLFRPPVDLLAKDSIWTVPRYDIPGRNNWLKTKQIPEDLARPHPLYVAATVEHLWFNKRKLIPCGYYQLWHYPTCPYIYPEFRIHPVTGRKEIYPNADLSDVDFSRIWEPSKRASIPDQFVYHLLMPGDRKRANWDGRTTPIFA